MATYQQDDHELDLDKKGDIGVGVSEVDDLSTQSPRSKLARFYRSALFQMLVVGGLAFCGPAMADAISGLGGGGAATPWTVNLGTTFSYVAVALVSLFGGPIVATLGLRNTLILGAMTFPINGSAYYVNSRYGVQWYLIVGRTIYGLGFGLWYVAEAAIILSYPEDHRRGVYLAIWVMSRNLGQLVGGSINLARNIKNTGAGGIAMSTYLIFVGIECIGFPISFLVSHPSKVTRADGTHIILSEKQTLKEECLLLARALVSKRNLLLTPYFFFSYFYGGVLGTYLSLYFSVRARALSSLVVPCGVMIGCAALGFLLDSKRFDQRRRAQLGFVVVILPTIASFAWLCQQQHKFIAEKPAKLDWTSSGYAAAYVPFFIMQVWGYLCQTYIYWLISCFSSSVQSNARQGGVFRCIEAVGQSVSYGLNSHASSRWIPLGVNFGLLMLAIPPTLMVVQSVPSYRSQFQEGSAEYEQEKAQRKASEGNA